MHIEGPFRCGLHGSDCSETGIEVGAQTMIDEIEHSFFFRKWLDDMKRNLANLVFLSLSLLADFRSLNAGAEKAWDHFKRQEYALAAAQFERIMASGSEDAASREGLGWCYYWLGRYDQAEREFSRALEIDPQSSGARNGMDEVKKWRYLVFNNAWQLFYSKDYSNALAVFISILEDTSGRLPAADLWQVHSGIGWSQYYLQNYSAAHKQFETILGIYKDNAFALKGLGFSQYQLKQYDESLKTLRSALAVQPEWADVQSMIGWNYYSKGDYTQALTEFQKALDRNTLLADAEYGKSWTYYKMNQIPDALTHFKTAIQLSPYHPGNFALLDLIEREKSWWPLFKELGWSHYRAGDYPSAAKMFSDGLTRLPDEIDLKRGLAFSIFKQGKYSDVIRILKEIRSVASELPPVIETGFASDGTSYTVRSNAGSMLAWSYYYIGELARAQTLFEEEIRTNPDWTDLYTGMGWCQLKKEQYMEAEKLFRKALELNPYYPVAMSGMNELKKFRYTDFNAAWTAYYAGDAATALAKFEAIAETGLGNLDEKDRWQVFSGIGHARLALSRPKEAVAAFIRVLELSPGNFYAYMGKARAEYALKSFKDAEASVVQAIRVNGDTSDVHALKGWILLGQSKLSEAREAFDRSLAINPSDADALAGYGWCRAEIGEKEEARSFFEKALQISAGHEKALEGIARLNK